MHYALCILLFIRLVHSLYLTNYQFSLINNLIQKPSLSSKQRESINTILYKAYENWAVKKALEFRQLHNYKCRNIKVDELIFSSKMGLFKSIKKYNGKHNFVNYSSIYVKSELLSLVTEKYSLSILPKSYRTKNKSNFTHEEIINYNLLLNTQLSCQYEKYKNEEVFIKHDNILDKINKKYENEEKISQIMNNLSDFEKRIYNLKYDNINNCIRSNKVVANLMCCSEETVRNHLNKW